jgi:hypothetical protein
MAGGLAEPARRAQMGPGGGVVAEVEGEVAEQRRQPAGGEVQVPQPPGRLRVVQHDTDELPAAAHLVEQRRRRRGPVDAGVVLHRQLELPVRDRATARPSTRRVSSSSMVSTKSGEGITSPLSTLPMWERDQRPPQRSASSCCVSPAPMRRL